MRLAAKEEMVSRVANSNRRAAKKIAKQRRETADRRRRGTLCRGIILFFNVIIHRVEGPVPTSHDVLPPASASMRSSSRTCLLSTTSPDGVSTRKPMHGLSDNANSLEAVLA